ncbi:MAG: hypothetical protein IJ646_05370 [Clostridia bacterium]|nr:hypothetical protein [Clostridia bacterium]
MSYVKKLLRRLCVLPIGASFAIAAGSFIYLGWALGHGGPAWTDYLAYHLSTYGLVVAVTALMRAIPAAWERLKASGPARRLAASPIGVVLRLDAAFRAWVALWLTMAWNVVVAGVKLAAGVALGSQWLKTLGVYYLLLAAVRLMLVSPFTPVAGQGWRRYRGCGLALLGMNGVLIVMVAQILRQQGGFHYPGPLIYLMALYAFWAMISATVKLARLHRRQDPLLSASRAVSLTAAMVSMLALETALIDRFGEDPIFHRNMTAAVGGAVCMIEVCMAVYMIHRGNREMK